MQALRLCIKYDKVCNLYSHLRRIFEEKKNFIINGHMRLWM